MRWRDAFREKSLRSDLKGVTWTELRSDLGKGNLAAGETAINEGLNRGDIVQKQGLYFMKSQLMSDTQRLHARGELP